MELLAVSTGAAIAYGIGLWVVLIIGPATIAALKGQWADGPGKLARAQSRYDTTLGDQEGVTSR